MSLAELDAVGAANSADAPVIEMDSVDKDFALGGFFNQTILRALSGVSLRLVRGRALALVGESGSGKSTCARMVAGVYKPTRGAIRWSKRPMPRRDWYRFTSCRSGSPIPLSRPWNGRATGSSMSTVSRAFRNTAMAGFSSIRASCP